jgi:hypothetical protein
MTKLLHSSYVLHFSSKIHAMMEKWNFPLQWHDTSSFAI